MHLIGRYCKGKGEAAAFTALEWVQSQCREKLGFIPYPGTANLRVEPQEAARLRQLAESKGVRLISPSAAYCDALCLTTRLKRKEGSRFLDGVLVFPLVGGYYSTIVEFLCPVEVKAELQLTEEEEMLLVVLPEDHQEGD
ncbi:MAG: DUF120 domain-containing protein [Moorellales bacterium]